MTSKNRPQKRAILTILFSAMVFIILAITMLIVGSALFLMIETGLIVGINSPNIWIFIVIIAIGSIFIGTFVAAIMSRVPLKPINQLINGMNILADGDYNIRIHLGNISILKELSNSFNALANELQKTEMISSDFINNFSHEFKTPIVSIRGFAKLLKKGNLSEENENEYLDIIMEESSRLADMSTKVLDLTKVENQNILTDISMFNLSEQIRNCILLLETKWIEKNLDILANFDEFKVNGNEELLKQVWINILDNAIKFSPEYGQIDILIRDSNDSIIVSIENEGRDISLDESDRIFDKFWQADQSRSSQGNGIGLSIAKRIIELHKGGISVDSSKDGTIFFMELPKP